MCTLAFGRLRQEDCLQFENTSEYIVNIRQARRRGERQREEEKKERIPSHTLKKKKKNRFGIFTEKELGTPVLITIVFKKFFLLFIYLLCGVVHVYKGQKTTFRSPSTIWVPGMKLRFSDLAASTLTC